MTLLAEAAWSAARTLVHVPPEAERILGRADDA